MTDYEKVYNDFWKSIVEPAGTLDIDAVKRELSDYHFVLDNVSAVYDEVTGGQASKPNIKSEVIIALANDKITELVQDKLQEFLTELEALKTTKTQEFVNFEDVVDLAKSIF